MYSFEEKTAEKKHAVDYRACGRWSIWERLIVCEQRKLPRQNAFPSNAQGDLAAGAFHWHLTTWGLICLMKSSCKNILYIKWSFINFYSTVVSCLVNSCCEIFTNEHGLFMKCFGIVASSYNTGGRLRFPVCTRYSLLIAHFCHFWLWMHLNNLHKSNMMPLNTMSPEEKNFIGDRLKFLSLSFFMLSLGCTWYQMTK